MPAPSLDPLIITSLYLKDNLSVHKIAKQFNVSPSGVFKLLKRYNVPIRSKSAAARFQRPDLRAQVAALVQSLAAQPPAVPLVDNSSSVLSTPPLVDNSSSVLSTGRKPLKDPATALADYAAGMSIREIAAKHGVSWSVVYYHVTKCKRPSHTPKAVRTPLPPLTFVDPSPLQLTGFLAQHAATIQVEGPPVVALVDKLAVVVMDPEVWDVHSVMHRLSVEHHEATKYLAHTVAQVSNLGYKSLCLWKDELTSPALENMIKHKTQQGARTCSARECDVHTVDNTAARAFYEANHLQGGCNAPVHYALFHGDVLVACMSFNRADACRGTADAHLLQRFAVSGSIPGAASKLLSAFRSDTPGAILSYSDERYAPGGGLYQALGFTQQEAGKPDYRYWDGTRWYAKNAKQRKHLTAELAERGEAPTTDDTEFTMAHRLGYRRCYDAGKRTWVLP
jgi:transposase